MWATYLQAYMKADEYMVLLTFLHVPYREHFFWPSLLSAKVHTNIQYNLKLSGPHAMTASHLN